MREIQRAEMGSACPAAGLEWTPVWVDQEQEDAKRQVREVVRREIRAKRGCATFEPQAHTGHRVHRSDSTATGSHWT